MVKNNNIEATKLVEVMYALKSNTTTVIEGVGIIEFINGMAEYHPVNNTYQHAANPKMIELAVSQYNRKNKAA